MTFARLRISKNRSIAVILISQCFVFGESYAAPGASLVTGTDPHFAEMIARCAPTVAPTTMAAIVSTESRGHQFAIADAGPVRMPWAQRKKLVRSYYLGSADEATAKANALIANGHTVSLGLSQVNDRNLSRLGMTVKQMFDPCINLGAGGRIMTEFYARASAKFGAGTRALNAALSAYNSGDWVRGEREGYVSQIYKQQGRRLAMAGNAAMPNVPSIASAPSVPGDTPGAVQTELDVSGRKFSLSATDFKVE